MSGAGAGTRDEPSSDEPPRRLVLPYDPAERLPWLLRGGTGQNVGRSPEERERDRLAALEARRHAVLGLPAVAVAWLLAVTLGGATGLRVGSLVALVLAVYVGVRAAITMQRFRRRWTSDEERGAPPGWVTLLTVASVVTMFVAVANLVADLQADRAALAAALWSGGAITVLGLGLYAHLAGGRSVAAALREPSTG